MYVEIKFAVPYFHEACYHYMLSGISPKTVNITSPTINLPTFDGNFAYWRELSEAFILKYLKSSLKGEPADLLRPLEIMKIT